MYFCVENEDATKGSQIVLDHIYLNSYEKIDVQKLVNSIEYLTNSKINVREFDFSENISIPKNCDVLMSVTKNKKIKEVKIILNSHFKINPKFRRFSLVYALGYLLFGYFSISKNPNKFITISEITYNLDHFNTYDNEKKTATIFALKVLIPFELLYDKIVELHDINKVANFFGLPKEAIKSRLMLGL